MFNFISFNLSSPLLASNIVSVLSVSALLRDCPPADTRSQSEVIGRPQSECGPLPPQDSSRSTAQPIVSLHTQTGFGSRTAELCFFLFELLSRSRSQPGIRAQSRAVCHQPPAGPLTAPPAQLPSSGSSLEYSRCPEDESY